MRAVRRAMPGLPVIMVALGNSGFENVQLDCAAGLGAALAGEVQSVAARIASLTTRERQVLNLIVAGRSNKVIAFELSISPRTVENHRARVMEKLGVKSVAELVRLALAAEDMAAGRAARFAAGNDMGVARPRPASA
jgi:DNA-binding NarL/FixJ family response regulator